MRPASRALALALVALGVLRSVAARADGEAAAAAAPRTLRTSDDDAETRSSLVEFSVGTLQAFDSTKVFRYGDEIELLPTTTAAFMVTYFVTRYWRASLVYELPLSTEKQVVSGQFVERSVPSILAGALAWAPFQFDLRNDTRLELEGMALGGVEMGDRRRFVPGLLGRIHLSAYSTGSTGFGVYLGVHYLFVVHQVGPLYGIGYRF